jgi:flagellar basal body-associated protein FliL
MTEKQGKENMEFVKEETDPSDNYIIQKNTKTKSGITIIVIAIIIILIAIGVSWYFFRADG